MTRTELLDKFKTYDTQQLEKLLTYATLFLIPEEDLLVNVTMKQMVDKAHQLATEYFPEWTDYSKGDFGQFGVEVMALFSEKDLWYVNAFANEAHLRDMSLYTSAFVRAIEMGYDPTLQKGATAPFNITVSPGNAYTIPVGGLVLALTGTSLQFTNDAAIVLAQSAQPVVLNLTLSEGTYSSTSIAFNGHEAPLGKTGIDIESILLDVNSSPWSRVRVFGQSGAQSKHFAVLPDADAGATVYFGDDGYGLRPTVQDSLLFRYRLCSGAAGNTVRKPVTVNQFPGARSVTAVTMIDAAKGGKTQESLESIKNSAPLYARFKKAAFNETATREFLLAQDNVLRAKVLNVSNNVYFYVVPKDPDTDEITFIAELRDLLAPYLMYGYVAVPSVTQYFSINEVTVNIFALKKSNLRKIEEQVGQLITDYTDVRVYADYGGNFSLNELAQLIRSNVFGVQNVEFVTVNGVSARDYTVAATRVMRRITSSGLHVTAAYANG